MKQNFFFKTLLMLGLFGSYIDDPNAGGGGGDDDFDIDLDDPEDPTGGDDPENPKGGDDPENPKGGDDPEKETVSKKEFDDVKKQLDENKEYIASEQQAKALRDVETSLKAKYDDFDMNKIKEHLVTLHKTNPELANSLNNSVGFENVYLTEFKPKPVDNDDVSLGRNVGSVERNEEIKEKIANGERITSSDKQSLLSKFI